MRCQILKNRNVRIKTMYTCNLIDNQIKNKSPYRLAYCVVHNQCPIRHLCVCSTNYEEIVCAIDASMTMVDVATAYEHTTPPPPTFYQSHSTTNRLSYANSQFYLINSEMIEATVLRFIRPIPPQHRVTFSSDMHQTHT